MAQRGPYDEAPYAEARALGYDVESARAGTWPAKHEALLDEALRGACVDLGEHDRAILRWLARWEPETVLAVVGWIERARR